MLRVKEELLCVKPQILRRKIGSGAKNVKFPELKGWKVAMTKDLYQSRNTYSFWLLFQSMKVW
jgi:hypothetical protein